MTRAWTQSRGARHPAGEAQPRTLWVGKKRSAIHPARKGDTIAPTAVVPATRPISAPEKRSVSPSHVPSVTYQALQMKYSKNIIRARRDFICRVIV